MKDVAATDWDRVLDVATVMTGDVERAAHLLRQEPLRAFDGQTAQALIQAGRAEDVISYLQSLAAGAAG